MTNSPAEQPAFEVFLTSLGMPAASVLNKPLFKRMFLEHADMDATDKKALKEDVEKVRWLYTLKPSTINIAPFSDELHDYGELAVLQVVLTNIKHAERIALFINRAIPYPLVIFFSAITAQAEQTEHFALCLADKRNSKADKDKWVIEDLFLSPWLDLNQPSTTDELFLTSLQLRNLPTTNFLCFYQALINRLIALECAEITGRFNYFDDAEQSYQQRYRLQQHVKTSLLIKHLRTQIKQAEFSQQVTLNTQIKQHEQTLKQLAECL